MDHTQPSEGWACYVGLGHSTRPQGGVRWCRFRCAQSTACKQTLAFQVNGIIRSMMPQASCTVPSRIPRTATGVPHATCSPHMLPHGAQQTRAPHGTPQTRPVSNMQASESDSEPVRQTDGRSVSQPASWPAASLPLGFKQPGCQPPTTAHTVNMMQRKT